MADQILITLPDAYDKRREPRKLTFRPLTPDEARTLPYRAELWFADLSGKARRCRVNGSPRTWKLDPSRVELPVKYGMYECDTAAASGGAMVLPTGRYLLVPTGGAA